MKIGGLQKFSLIDYPGKTCAIIFTQGCNFRCRYCHNPELVLSDQFVQPISVEKIVQFLTSRQGQLDAVTITGGEPTLHSDLITFISQIKKIGFLVKLDTNGTNSGILQQLIEQKLVDYLAMDIKAPLEKYEKIVDTTVLIEEIKTSINLIINSDIDHEFRTTIVKSLTSLEDLLKIGKTVQGAQNYYLQRFIPSKLIDDSLMNQESYSQEELEKAAKKISHWVEFCKVR
jgi:pyruvate formate lyase activating enzyme